MKKEWKIKQLGEICVFENGDRGKNYPSRSKLGNSGIPFINAGNLSERGITYDGLKYMSNKQYDLLSQGKIKEGDILFCLRGSLGKFSIVKGLNEGAIASSLVIVRASNLILKEYLAAYFGSQLCRDMINKYSNGAAQPNLSARSLKEFEIPLPPIPEQKRIVAILDKAFAAIDRAKANAEKNLANARELFESYLNKIFANPGEDWEEKKLGEIGKVSMCKRVFKEQTTTQGDIPFYKIGTFGKKPNAYISNKLYSEFRKKFSFPKKGDVLLSASGTIGRRVIYNGEPAYFQDSNIVWINNDEKQVLNDYLYHFYGACNWNSTKGATISRLYNDNLRQIEIAFPKSFEEQKNITFHLDKMLAKSKKLETIYQQKLDDLEELKKSILQKAFNGQLTIDN